MRVLLTVARNTFLESIRQPIYGLIVTTAALLIALLPLTAHHLYVFTTGTGLERVSQRLVADLGISTVQLAGLILAVFVTTSVVSREIDEKTAATVLSKPVGRGRFVFGKYLGVALALLLGAGVVGIVTVLTVRVGAVHIGGGHGHGGSATDWGVISGMLVAFSAAALYATLRNYFSGRPWVGSYNSALVIAFLLIFIGFMLVDKDYFFIWQARHDDHLHDYGGKLTAYDWEVAGGVLLSIEAVLLLASVAVAASTRVAVVGNAAFTGLIYLLGLVRGPLETWLGGEGLLVGGLRLVVPNLERYWLGDALIREQPIPWVYLLEVTAYTGMAVLAWLMVACFLFDSRDVG